MSEELDALGLRLRAALGPLLSDLIETYASGQKPEWMVSLPTSEDAGADARALASLVAKTSNAFSQASYLAGLARAEFKLAEGDHKKRYKKAKAHGANAEEREANAMLASEQEHDKLTLISSVVELAEAAESAMRVASESARKLLDKSVSQHVGNARSEYGRSLSNDPF